MALDVELRAEPFDGMMRITLAVWDKDPNASQLLVARREWDVNLPADTSPEAALQLAERVLRVAHARVRAERKAAPLSGPMRGLAAVPSRR